DLPACSVRLCVVAPTVNIDLGGGRRSSGSGGSGGERVSTPLPREQIRAFIQSVVLPRFTRILLLP
ncbi:unnamed protein product, partial [Phaeothamnion confervicola]